MYSAVLSSTVQIKYSFSGHVPGRGQAVYDLVALIRDADIKGVLGVEMRGSTQSIIVATDLHLVLEVKEAVDDLLEPHLPRCFRLQRPPS